MNDQILIVNKEEHHYWPTCPCEACERTREYRKPTSNRHIKLTPGAAYILGFIPRLSPGGSLTRDLQAKQAEEQQAK